MIKDFTDYYFWFSQPPTILTDADKILGYFFIGLFGLSIIFWLSAKLNRNPITKKLFKKLQNLLFTMAISGLIWFGIRYENTPLFGQRYWALLTIIIAIIWLLLIFKYLLFNYRFEKKEYDRELLKNKYIPKSK